MTPDHEHGVDNDPHEVEQGTTEKEETSADKHLLSDYLIDPEIPFAHWLWSRLSMYSRTDWLAISVVWPVPFGSCLLRRVI